MLDQYYILSHGPFMPDITFRNLLVSPELVQVVSSSDNPSLDALHTWADTNGTLAPLVFERGEYLHDPYLSLMHREAVEEYYPMTATPARRFISDYEHRLPGDRAYAVFDDDVRFHISNPFRMKGEGFQDSVWDVAKEALRKPAFWACTFVNQFTWRGSYLKRGVPARRDNPSLWHRTGSLSAQSTWVLSNRERHMWFSPILEDYITTARYAALGRAVYVLDEYAHVEPPNQLGTTWSNDDPLDRDSLAYYIGEQRILGVSSAATGTKPFKKYSKYIYPVLEVNQ